MVGPLPLRAHPAQPHRARAVARRGRQRAPGAAHRRSPPRTGLDPVAVERDARGDARAAPARGPGSARVRAAARRRPARAGARCAGCGASGSRRAPGVARDRCRDASRTRSRSRAARSRSASRSACSTATRRLFRFWHVAHRPFAITALLAVLVHVAVAIGGDAARRWRDRAHGPCSITTLAFVARHRPSAWRCTCASRARPAAARPARACPRCRAARARTAPRDCPRCGVPLQAYELVTAPLGGRGTAAAASGGALHAVVRADVCVGCGTCVAACPEPGAIRLVEQARRAWSLALCKGHGECVARLPGERDRRHHGRRGAARRGARPRRALRDATCRASTSSASWAAAGSSRTRSTRASSRSSTSPRELADRERRRRAAAATARRGRRGLGPGRAQRRARGAPPRPALRRARAGHARRHASHAIRATSCCSPSRCACRSTATCGCADASKESLLQVWQTRDRADRPRRCARGQRVEAVDARRPTASSCAPASRASAPAAWCWRSDGAARRAGSACPGEELDKVFYDIVEMEAFAGRRVLVVGGGDSAVESALGLANQAGTEVTLSYRGADVRARQGAQPRASSRPRCARPRQLLLEQPGARDPARVRGARAPTGARTLRPTTT